LILRNRKEFPEVADTVRFKQNVEVVCLFTEKNRF
jgi:hypothetical protein